MKKVLIVSISRDEQKRLTEAAVSVNERELSFDSTASFGQDAVWWTTAGPDVLVLSLPPDDLMQGYFLTKLRDDVPRAIPLVLLTNTITAAHMALSQIFTRIRIVKMPAPGPTLLKAILDLTTAYAENQRQGHPRYLTDQPVEISSGMTGTKCQAIMRNLSLSGIYFESIQEKAEFKEAEVVKIFVQMGTPAREYIFDAKVVWSKPLTNVKGWGFGATFIDREEVYNNLLKGF